MRGCPWKVPPVIRKISWAKLRVLSEISFKIFSSQQLCSQTGCFPDPDINMSENPQDKNFRIYPYSEPWEATGPVLPRDPLTKSPSIGRPRESKNFTVCRKLFSYISRKINRAGIRPSASYQLLEVSALFVRNKILSNTSGQQNGIPAEMSTKKAGATTFTITVSVITPAIWYLAFGSVAR